MRTTPPFIIVYAVCLAILAISAREIWRDYQWKSLSRKPKRRV